MTSLHHSSDHDVDSGAAADHPPPPPARWQHEDNSSAPRIRLMCSFGGRILPRPHDNQLRYVGGDTRIVAVHRSCTFSTLLSKLAKFTATADITVKYQLPNEELDSLISVTTDEDVDNMMEEYDRLLPHGNSVNSRNARLRLFLFPSDGSGAFGSILSGTGGSKHEHWFVDMLNGRTLERGRSEASSIVSEVPDYLFGLDNNSDEPIKPVKTSVSVSDPGSPSPVVSSPHYSPVENKPEVVDNPVVPQPVWQYVEQVPAVYYVPGPAQGGSMPVRPVQMSMPYVQPVQPVVHRQIPVGYRPVYMPGAYDYPVGPSGGRPETYEAAAGGGGGLMRNNPGMIPVYRQAGESPVISGSDTRIARNSQ